MSTRIFQGESRSMRSGFHHAFFDPGVEKVFGRFFGDCETFGLDECAGVLCDAIQLILKRDVESSGHSYIIAAVSVFLVTAVPSATFVPPWQESVGCDFCATVLL